MKLLAIIVAFALANLSVAQTEVPVKDDSVAIGVIPTRVPICFEGETKRVPLKALPDYLEKGATRGKCKPIYTFICVNGRKTKSINAKFLERHLKRNNVVKGRCVCKKDLKKCKNGRVLKRDPRNLCRFPKCACDKDVKRCPSGKVVRRNPKKNCRFNDCPPLKPKCCDARIQVDCLVGTPKCCAITGKWMCPIASG